MVGANSSALFLSAGAAPQLTEGPVNAIRLTLHPEGIAPQIVNLRAWKAHTVLRLRRQFALTRDPVIKALLDEISSYPPTVEGKDLAEAEMDGGGAVMLPLILRTNTGTLSFFGTTTVFGSAVEVTLSELALEAFYPADEQTKTFLRQLEADTSNAPMM